MKIPKLHIESTNQVYALELMLRARDLVLCNIVVARKKGNKLMRVRGWDGISLHEAIVLLKGKNDVIVSVTGKGVLLKRVTSASGPTTDVLRQVLPNAQPMDFYVQTVFAGHETFAGVVRADWLEPVLKELIAANILFTQLLIGPFAATMLKEQVFADQLAYAAGGYRFVYSENRLTEISVTDKEQTDIGIQENILKPHEIIPFCHLIVSAVGGLQVTGPETELMHELQTQVVWRKRFRTSLVAAVAVCFVLLASNLVLSRMYGATFQHLDNEFAENRTKLALIEKLEKEIQRKTELMGGQFSQGPVLSFMADELASSIPAGIKLSDMQVFPVEGKIRKDQPIVFNRGQVQVMGITHQSQDLNKWIKNLKQLHWIKDISIANYAKPQTGGQGEFRLIIEVSV